MRSERDLGERTSPRRISLSLVGAGRDHDPSEGAAVQRACPGIRDSKDGDAARSAITTLGSLPFAKTREAHQVGHAQWVFTIPKMLRIYLLHHRELLGALSRAGYETVKELMAAAVEEKGYPHVHELVPGVLYVPKAGHDDLQPTEVERVDAMEFVARVLVQIPDPRRHLVRYYGAYSNATRGKRKKAAAPSEPSSPDEVPLRATLPEGADRAALRRRWAELIRRVYEVRRPRVSPLRERNARDRLHHTAHTHRPSRAPGWPRARSADSRCPG
jgi:Putative transposase